MLICCSASPSVSARGAAAAGSRGPYTAVQASPTAPATQRQYSRSSSQLAYRDVSASMSPPETRSRRADRGTGYRDVASPGRRARDRHPAPGASPPPRCGTLPARGAAPRRPIPDRRRCRRRDAQRHRARRRRAASAWEHGDAPGEVPCLAPRYADDLGVGVLGPHRRTSSRSARRAKARRVGRPSGEDVPAGLFQSVESGQAAAGVEGDGSRPPAERLPERQASFQERAGAPSLEPEELGDGRRQRPREVGVGDAEALEVSWAGRPAQ